MELTQTQLRHRLTYDPSTGHFTWANPNKYRPEYKGQLAGTLHKYGYVHISVDGKVYKAHRLAWLYIHGAWPLHHIDHINGQRADNRITNLRDVTMSQNAENRKQAREGHACGFLGVVWRARNKKYEARISIEKRYKYLGLYATAEEAHAAYLAAKRAGHRSFTEA